MTNIIAFIIIVILSLVIALLSLWVADKVADAAANKMAANKSDSKVTVRRWSFWGVSTYRTSQKDLWYNAVYSITVNIVFRSVAWILTNMLASGINVAKRSQASAY